jgi:hypothetical protein
LKLFAIYVGGEAQGANIEVHDMRFVAAPGLRDTYAELRKQWWGTPASLHIDCWAELSHVDGYDVTLSSDPFTESLQLYYINMGGYDPAEFSERHMNVFVVARSVSEAKRRAKLATEGWNQPHRDDMYEAEQAFCLNEVATGERLHIHLTPSATPVPFSFTCRYISIGNVRSPGA